MAVYTADATSLIIEPLNSRSQQERTHGAARNALKVYVGSHVRKLRSGRIAQVSALDKDYAHLYWPGCAKGAHRQSRIPRKRLENWASEWQLVRNRAKV